MDNKYTEGFSRFLRWCFLLLCVAMTGTGISWAQKQDTIDSVHVETPIDTLAAHLTQLETRYKPYRTNFLTNINVGVLIQELEMVGQKNKEVAGLLDSLDREQLVDTIGQLANLAKENEQRLKAFRNTVQGYRNSLEEALGNLKQLGDDSVLTMGRGAVANAERLNNMHNLRFQIRQTEFQAQQKLDSVNNLIHSADRLISEAQNLQSHIGEGVQQVEQATRNRKNVNYIWSAPKVLNKENIVGNLRTTYQETGGVKTYLVDTEWTGRILLLLLSIAFFYWIFSNGKSLYSQSAVPEQLDTPEATATEPYHWGKDVLQALVFFFTLLPLFAGYTPSILIQGTQLLIILLLMWQAHYMMDRGFRRLWVLLLIFYVLVIVANSMVGDGLIMRLITMSLNIINLVFSYRLRKGLKERGSHFQINRYVHLAFVVINLLAILLNVIGYVEYARYWSIAGAVGLAQSVSLHGFSSIVKAAFRLQFAKSRLFGGLFRNFNEDKTLAKIHKYLTLLCLLLGIIVLAINLQQVQTLYITAEEVLSKIRKIGSISFSLGDLLVCVIIISLADWLQKNLAIFFGDRKTEDEERLKTANSLMPLFRLFVIVVGFLFGISALGIGVDKLTVIISALTVGIGFGLQNVFNNFVSGIILIFEKPFRNGDYIELADKKGWVKEIGIRSSTLLTEDGAEVVIPNGDLLSGRLVNWTLSKSTSRIGIAILVDKKADVDVVKKAIREEVKKVDHFVKGSAVDILLVGVTADKVQLKISCWIVNIYNQDVFRSQLLERLNNRLAIADIELVSA